MVEIQPFVRAATKCEELLVQQNIRALLVVGCPICVPHKQAAPELSTGFPLRFSA
jgi:hypothetical protein